MNVVQSDVLFGGGTKKHQYDFLSHVCTLCKKSSRGRCKDSKDKEELLKRVCKKHLKRKYKPDIVFTLFKESRNGKLKCKLCKKKLTSQAGMLSHVETIHCGIRYQCDRCGFVCTQRSIFTYHLKKGICEKRQKKQNKKKIPVCSFESEEESGDDVLSEDDEETAEEEVSVVEDEEEVVDKYETEDVAEVEKEHTDLVPEIVVLKHLKKACSEDEAERMCLKIRGYSNVGTYFECQVVGCNKWSRREDDVKKHIQEDHCFCEQCLSL